MKSAFYQKPVSVKTSIEIINEARASLRLVETTRPNTPHTPLDLEHADRLSLQKRAGSQPKRLSAQGNRLNPLPPDATAQSPQSLLHKTASLQDLYSSDDKDVDKNRRIHSGPTSKSPVNLSVSATNRSSDNWNEELSTLFALLEEFVANSDMLFKDEKAIRSLVNMITKLELPTSDRFSQLRVELLQKIFDALKTPDKYSVQLKLAIVQLAISLGLNDVNMTNMCKLIYKLCRALPRGALFENQESRMLPVVLLNSLANAPTSPSDDTSYERIGYCLSCLKLISADENGARLLVKHDAVKIVTNKLFLLLSAIDLDDQVNNDERREKIANLCLQFLGVLRNVSEVNTSMESFRNSNTFAAIFDTMICFSGNTDLMLMCTRVLSKTSLDVECCCCIAEVLQSHSDGSNKMDSNVFYFLGNLMLQHCNNQDISVRLAFTVGNIVTEYPDCISTLVAPNNKSDVALTLYLTVFSNFVTKSVNSADDCSRESVDNLELATKTARLLANAAVDEKVGIALATSNNFLETALRCLSFIEIHVAKPGGIYENLIAAILAALNNITFYALESLSEQPDVALWTKKLDFSHALIPFLMLDHRSSLLLDALHVLANFSRFQEVRNLLLDFKTLDICLALVDANSPQLSFVSCGLLVNFSIDVQSRQLLLDSGCLEKIHDALVAFANPANIVKKKTAPVFLPLVDVACKLLLNLTGTVKTSSKRSKCTKPIANISKLYTTLLDNLKKTPTLPDDDDFANLLNNLMPTLITKLNELVK